MRYVCKFRRNNKERYWTIRELEYLSDFKTLLENILEKTEEEELQIIIRKVV